MTDRLPAVQKPLVIDVISHSPAQTVRIGERLGALLRPGDLVVLHGPFGAGKTHLIKGIGRGLGVAEEDVTSPSFVLINEYQAAADRGGFPVLHVDLYRLESGSADFESIGLEECWEGHSLCLIEWAERAQELLPAERLEITLDHLSETKRVIRMEPRGRRYEEVLAQLKGRAFSWPGRR
ncbi:MAG: tRNA (adenosine(37)-N6)-threonylcarbamoyltransferase complex ATPase subunit type 1 TsaE [Herpetosiphonaceae bacterium]|nr:MAG: tRNA (adenosine(37)-N6)-threonylcarbamoyltransferase complex ATPase subunit type 1 TsaE [Herpetosiphonaceae bacterium]